MVTTIRAEERNTETGEMRVTYGSLCDAGPLVLVDNVLPGDTRSQWISVEEARKAWESGDHRGRSLPSSEMEALAKSLAKADLEKMAAARDAQAAKMIAALERDPVTSPSSMSKRSILKSTTQPSTRAVYGISLMILLAILAAASILLSGCSTTEVADMKAVAAKIETDAHTVATLVLGAATAIKTAAAANPAAVAELGALASSLATKEGVSAEDQAVLKSEITPANLDTVIAVAAKIQTATVASAPAKSP